MHNWYHHAKRWLNQFTLEGSQSEKQLESQKWLMEMENKMKAGELNREQLEVMLHSALTKRKLRLLGD